MFLYECERYMDAIQGRLCFIVILLGGGVVKTVVKTVKLDIIFLAQHRLILHLKTKKKVQILFLIKKKE